MQEIILNKEFRYLDNQTREKLYYSDEKCLFISYTENLKISVFDKIGKVNISIDIFLINTSTDVISEKIDAAINEIIRVRSLLRFK